MSFSHSKELLSIFSNDMRHVLRKIQKLPERTKVLGESKFRSVKKLLPVEENMGSSYIHLNNVLCIVLYSLFPRAPQLLPNSRSHTSRSPTVCNVNIHGKRRIHMTGKTSMLFGYTLSTERWSWHIILGDICKGN